MAIALLRALVFREPLPRGFDLLLGGLPADPPRRLDLLARLQRLVHLEEVLYLKPIELRDVGYVAQVSHSAIGGWYAEEPVVAALLVSLPEHDDRTAAVPEAT